MSTRDAATGWQLGEDTPAAYETYLVPRFFGPWAERLADLSRLRAGERVLDVGCGTGAVARAAHRRGASATGLDVNEAMLATARRLAPAIEWRQGDAADLPYPDASFDVVLCQQALQFLPDPDLALGEMRRVLGAGGRAAVAVLRSLDRHPAYAVFADALERHAGPEAGQMMRSPFPSLGADELRGLLSDADFHDVRMLIDVREVRYPSAGEFVRQEAASSPLAGPLGALDADVRRGMIEELGDALRDFTDDDGIVFPMETFMAVGMT